MIGFFFAGFTANPQPRHTWGGKLSDCSTTIIYRYLSNHQPHLPLLPSSFTTTLFCFDPNTIYPNHLYFQPPTPTTSTESTINPNYLHHRLQPPQLPQPPTPTTSSTDPNYSHLVIVLSPPSPRHTCNSTSTLHDQQPTAVQVTQPPTPLPQPVTCKSWALVCVI